MQPQEMQFMRGGKLVQKGIKSILQERGLWTDSLKLPEARKLLAEQPDFRQQQEWVVETLTKAGHHIIYLPKFHCELNYIEHLWCAAKAYARSHCTYSFAALKGMVPEALDSVSLATFRRLHRRCQCYMYAYAVRDENGEGLTFAQARFAVRKYSSHRKIPDSIFKDLPKNL